MYTEQIAKDLDEKQGIMILLNGKWGSGKTHHWKYFISQELRKKTPLYFSLFGLPSVEELKKEIFNNYITTRTNLSFKYFFSALFPFIFIACIIIGLNFSILAYINRKIADIQSIEDSKIISFIKQAIESLSMDNIFLIIFCIPLFIIIPLFMHRQTIATYFLNKFMGINYNNVCIHKLYSHKKTIFCFDDFERIAHTAAEDEFLGYFNSLSKTYKFNILIIANSIDTNSPSNTSSTNNIDESKCSSGFQSPTNTEALEQNYLIKYQEKLFDRIYVHDDFDNFQKFLNDLQTNQTLRICLDDIYTKLKFANTHPNIYKESERCFINMASNNLRLLKKIKDNMDVVYNNISVSDLENEQNHTMIINFVACMTLGFETGRYIKTDDFCDNGMETFIYAPQHTSEKDFREIFFNDFFYNYRSIYDLIYKGKITDKLKKELLPSQYNKYTTFEKYTNQLHEKHFLNYHSSELKDWLKKIDACIKHDDVLFSSYDTMGFTLGTYCILLDYNGKHLISHNTLTNIKKGISSLIKSKNILPNEFHHPSYGWSSDGDTEKDFNYLNKYIFFEELKNEAQKLKESDNLLNDFLQLFYKNDDYILKILSLLIISNQLDIDLESIYLKNFDMFQQFVRRILTFNCNVESYKNICKTLRYPCSSYKNLVNKISKILQKYAVMAKEYSSEYKNYKNFLTDMEKVRCNPIYTATSKKSVATKKSKTKSKK